MSDDSFLEKIRTANQNYKGELKSITFIADDDGTKKRIFKWLFKSGEIDFYITFSSYICESYHCGTVEHPQIGKRQAFNAVSNGKSSKIPVKFSYHRDGKVHFKPEERKGELDKKYKLAEIQAVPLDKLTGHHLFTIIFDGLEKFADFSPRSKKDGELEMFLPVPKDIIDFELRAYAGTTE